MKMKRLFYLIIYLTITLAALEGQEVTVTTVFDTSRIYIGDQIHYNVTVDQPSGLNLELKSLKDTLCKNIEIVSGPVTDTTILTDNRLRLTSKYLITSFDSGSYQVPPVYAEIKNKSGIKRFYSDYSPLKVIRVNIAPADTVTKIFDIIKPYRARVTIGEIIPWILLAALAASIIWGSIRLMKRFKWSKEKPAEVIDPDPAHVIAFRDLEKLREEQLWQKGEVKLYYSRLTEILRQYLENRYKIFSLEMTTSETLEMLIKTGFKKDDDYAKLKTILNGSDLVKFAKYKPEPSENELHFDNSWSFVETTKAMDVIIDPSVTNVKNQTAS
jgi:hypothetical protein